MKRNPILLTLLSLLLSFSVVAQEEGVFMECHYAENYKDNLLKKEKVHQDEMVLRIGRHTSEFFSMWNRKYQILKDSIFAKGGTAQEAVAARKALGYPYSSQKYTIYKGIPGKGMLTFIGKVFSDKYRYVEKLETPAWRILKEEKEVAGYHCQKAEADFLGRKWIAWFTPDIPVQEGPWKLGGLPGLILEAEDSEQDYSFRCIELKNVTDGKEISVQKGRYIKCSKEEYIKALTECEEDINKAVKKRGLSGVFIVGDDGKMTPMKANIKYNYIER